MHYANGREAKNGDKVIILPQYAGSHPVVGILYDAQAGNDYCNGKVAPISPSDPCPNLKECLHLDDALAAIGSISVVRDITAPPPTIEELDAILNSEEKLDVVVNTDGSVTAVAASQADGSGD